MLNSTSESQKIFDLRSVRIAAISGRCGQKITDEQVINDFLDLSFMRKDKRGYCEIMRNIHGETPEFNTPEAKAFLTWTDVFCTFVENEVLPTMRKSDINFREMETYHAGLGRNIIVLVTLLHHGIIRKDEARKALGKLMKPECVGVHFDDFLMSHGDEYFNDDTFGDEEMCKLIDDAITNNQKAVAEFLGGREKSLMAIAGYAMKNSKNADPKNIVKSLREKLLKQTIHSPSA